MSACKKGKKWNTIAPTETKTVLKQFKMANY